MSMKIANKSWERWAESVAFSFINRMFVIAHFKCSIRTITSYFDIHSLTLIFFYSVDKAMATFEFWADNLRIVKVNIVEWLDNEV